MVGAAALALLLAACSSPAAARPPLATSSGVPKASQPAIPNAGLLTGTQLKTLLAPASWFPSGSTVDPQGSVDTGDYLQPVRPPGPLACSRLDAVSWVRVGNGGAVSFAQNDYLDASSDRYAQEIDLFEGTTAADVMATIRSVAFSCRTFQDPQTASTVTVALGRGPQLGDDALTITLKDSSWGGEMTLEAVRVRSAVISVLVSSASGTRQAEATGLAGFVTTDVEMAGCCPIA
jgi:hypothetical protein